MSVQAPAQAGPDAADVVLTAASTLAPDHTDAYAVNFPTYSYRPDVTITAANGATVGAGVYDSGNGSTESSYFPTTLTPRTITVNFADNGLGKQPTPDSLVVRAPATTKQFDFSYRSPEPDRRLTNSCPRADKVTDRAQAAWVAWWVTVWRRRAI